MELDPKDYDVVRWLTKLKYADEAYPSDLLASRRQHYTRRVAAIAVGLGVAAGLKSTIKSGKSRSFVPTASNLIETALVVAIVAEVSTAAYFYRNEISKLVQSYSSNPQVLEVTSPPEMSSPVPGLIITKLPEITATPTSTETPTETQAPSGTVAKNDGNSDQTKSTPDPNGNQFGQTPKP